MTQRDIDRPVQGRSRGSSRFGGRAGITLLAVALLSAVGALGWTFWQAWQDERPTRVALGEEVVIRDRPAAGQADADGPAAEETDPDTGTVMIGGEVVQRMAPLEGGDPSEGDVALLEPTDQADGAAVGFVPRIEPQVRRLPGVPDAALTEPSEFGPLPRIGPDGLRPLDAYAQPFAGGVAARLAVVVGGLGLSQTGTLEAIERLPPGITLGFSPLGNSLNRWMSKATKEGHEVVLQLPMEPLGYPTIDPGPRTLTSDAQPGANLANLRWALGRMTNYPLVMNYLGAGMLTRPDALKPLLEEVGARGVAWFDDGSVPASMVSEMAEREGLPHAKGSLTIDASRDDEAIRRQLARLEQLAKSRGSAAGVATAFPTSVDIIAQWARDLEARGVVLVPLSNLVEDRRR